jgi:hypothetical protein
MGSFKIAAKHLERAGIRLKILERQSELDVTYLRYSLTRCDISEIQHSLDAAHLKYSTH